MSKELSPMQARQRLSELIKDIRFAMFTARHDGQLHSRPMTTQLPEDDDSAPTPWADTRPCAHAENPSLGQGARKSPQGTQAL